MCANKWEVWLSGSSFLKSIQINLFQGKTGRGHFPTPRALGPSSVVIPHPLPPLTTASFLLWFCGFVDASFVGFQSRELWGLIIWVEVLKVGAAVAQSPNPPCTAGWFWTSSLTVWCCTNVAFWQECVSVFPAAISVWVFSQFHLMCRSHSAHFWIYFRSNCSLCSCMVGGVQRRGIRSLCSHLGKQLLKNFLKEANG